MKVFACLSAFLNLVLFEQGRAFAPLGRSTLKKRSSTIHKALQSPDVAKEFANELISIFEPVNNVLSNRFQESLSEVLDGLTKAFTQFQSTLENVDAPLLKKVEETKTGFQMALQAYFADHPSFQSLFNRIEDQMTLPSLNDAPPSFVILASALVTYVVVSYLLNIGQTPPPSRPYPLQRYDPFSARAYFDRRPAKVVARALEIATTSTWFGLRLLQDYFK